MTPVQHTLRLKNPPVAVAFLSSPPAGVPKRGPEEVPAGCAFWREAQEGAVFYTGPSDHFNCAVGAYTHGIPLPPERAPELEETVTFMVQKSYLRMEDVPGIPHLASSPQVIAYGPVDSVPFAPDAVILAANPAQAMLVYEACARVGAASVMSAIGRPACAVLPLALAGKSAAISLGCKGNRTFTGLPDDEMYVVVPGDKWAAVAEQLATVTGANEVMGQRYRDHKSRFEDAGAPAVGHEPA